MDSLVKFSSPSMMAIVGSTSSGKSVLCSKILQNVDQMFDHKIEHILFCYTVYQPLYAEMEQNIKNITFHQGVPTHDDLRKFAKPGHHYCLVLDDLQQEVVTSKEMSKVATIYSHQLNINTIIIMQNMFISGSYSQTINLQIQYYVLLKSLRSLDQLGILSRQVFPGRGNFIPDAFRDVYNNAKYPYMIVDLHPRSDDRYRVRTHIFPGEDITIYQTPKK